MQTRQLANNATVSGPVTISTISNSSINALVLNMSAGPFLTPKAIVKYANGGGGTCGISLKDVLTGASYFAIAVAANGTGIQSFDRGNGLVQLTISNISGTISINAWLDD